MERSNRSGLVGVTEKADSLGSDVGLVSKAQGTESFTYTKMMSMTHPPGHHHNPWDSFAVGFGDDGSGGALYCNSSKRVPCLSDIYDVVGAGSGSVSGGAVVVPRTLHPFTSHTSFKPSVSALDLRFSSGSDPEPWRCRRTDGKKWRCSRDVAPDQKYCERHTHKSRSRSRKPVDLQPNNNLNTHPSINLPANTSTAPAFQKPIFQVPAVVSAATYDPPPRCAEWLMEWDTNLVSGLNPQWQQLMQSSSTVGLNRENTDHKKDVYPFQPHYGEEKEPTNPNPKSYVDIAAGPPPQILQNQLLNNEYYPLLGPKLDCLQASSNADRTQTTMHFIDAWSSVEREEMIEISNRCSVSSAGKLPLSSLTLSMSARDGIDEENEKAQMGLGMMDSGECGGDFKSQWLNPVSWMGSPPGGPLGEALCLGISSTAKMASNLPPPYSHSNSTTTSSSSKSSCEDSGHGLHYIK
ncbi:hypothetical protein F0562_007051 [Nyssa sinensis]|uniref:Growth-regulating factor n=1 Tax=Nyssa sinensis TaxID=561372 RepID=A0A5J5A1Y4_9ASTE|nr:hypothetical protein F0562_007051 [Nyssa sinensis]